MCIHKNETHIAYIMLPALITEIIDTFNCYINNLALLKTSRGQRKKKEIKVDSERTSDNSTKSLYASIK